MLPRVLSHKPLRLRGGSCALGWSRLTSHVANSLQAWKSYNAKRTYSSHKVPARLPLFSRAAEHAANKKVAMVSNLGAATYADLLRDSSIVANHLSKHDLQEQTVSFLTPHNYDYVKSQWAIWRAGGVAVPLCTSHPEPELEYHILDSGSKNILVSDSYYQKLEPIAKKHNLKLFNLANIPNEAPASDAPVHDIDPSRRAQIIYTSGTTGKPKGVVTTHEIIASQVKTLVDAWEWQGTDHILHVLPLHHVHGVINALLCPLWAGAKIEMLPKFDATEVWNRFMAQDGVSVYMAVPTIYQKLIQEYDAMSPENRAKASEGIKKLRLMVSGSAALPVPVFNKWEKISGHRLLERFGMTEIGMCLSNPLHGERQPGKVGVPLPGVQVKIQVDEDATEQNIGELLVKGSQIFLEYHNRPEATKETFTEDGWFKTGDSVEIDANGVYKIVGRRSVDIIKSAGYKISALDIEAVLLDHHSIKEVAIVGLPDEEWGQIVGAITILKDPKFPMSLQTLQTWCRSRLANYKIPRKIIVVSEIPRNAMGKINKKELVKMFDRK